jgi:hypothetical protein
MGPLSGVFCHEHGFWREFCGWVTVGDFWRGGSADRLG